MAEARKYITDETSFSGRFSGQVLHTVRMSFRPWAVRIVLLFVSGIIGRLLLLSTANILGYWADSFCRGGSHCRGVPSLFQGWGHTQYLELLLWVAGIGFVINSVFRVGISRTGALAVSHLYDEVTWRTSRLPMSFFDSTPVGRIMSRFSSDYGSVFRMAGGPLGEFMCLVFDLMLMVVLMSFASPWFLPVILAVIILNGLAYRYNNPIIRQERRLLSRDRGPAIAHFAETVQGAVPIKVYGKGESFLSRYNMLVGKVVVQKFRTLLSLMSFNLQMTTITASVLLFTGVGGIWLVKQGLVSVGDIAVAFTFIMMTSTTIQQFFEWLSNMEEALTGVERMDEYLRKPLEKGRLLPPGATFQTGQPVATIADTAVATDEAARLAGPKTLNVSHLWLRYRDDLPWVLQDINFSVSPGEHFAVIGRTGSGKSSLIQALFLMYPPQQGGISINGIEPELTGIRPCPAGQIPLQLFRRHLTLIPQEPVLFRGTLRQNLSISGSTSDAEIWDALRQIRIDQWARQLTSGEGSGLDYPIDERGANLSMGERQLLCMTRAMLQPAEILIMDEATSSVDPASEALLMRALREVLKDRTRIVVAHRLSTIADADRVLELDHGQIRRIAAPRELGIRGS
jgi:ABC-type multidrug transport system fused ATPase/permease subunit